MTLIFRRRIFKINRCLSPIFIFILASQVCSKDLYPNFAALKAARKEGKDYSITLKDRRAPVSVMAIHGGIETGTEKIAEVCAGTDWNLYIFKSLSAGNGLHVTAAKFDEPKAVSLAAASLAAFSIHGQDETGKTICVGGGNSGLAAASARELKKNGFSVEYPCRRLPGKSPKNIANRAKRGGVQLEISAGEIGGLSSGDGLQKFCGSLRAAAETLLPNKVK